MNRRSLMISTMLMSAIGVGGVVGFSGSACAAACAVTDCAALGYTDAYNSSGNCLKCPFGEAYSCEKGYICPEGYDYTCSGTGYAGGVGDACNGKYTECTCSEGYKLENGSCVENKAEWGTCSGYAANCALGDILFSDGTCSANAVSGKTPIAVVVYKSSDGKCGQAMALKSIGDYEWGGYGTDISTLPNLSQSQASQDVASCENSKKIMAAVDKSTYPAAWAAHEYKTAGTSAGDWCLPAAGIITSIYNNQSVINTGFSRANGTKFSSGAWSSSEYDRFSAWYSHFGYSYGLDNIGKNTYSEVRPVLAF